MFITLNRPMLKKLISTDSIIGNYWCTDAGKNLLSITIKLNFWKPFLLYISNYVSQITLWDILFFTVSLFFSSTCVLYTIQKGFWCRLNRTFVCLGSSTMTVHGRAALDFALQTDLDRVCSGARLWNLRLNVGNCVAMRFGAYNTDNNFSCSYSIDGKVLDFVTSHKYFGRLMLIDSKLWFHDDMPFDKQFWQLWSYIFACRLHASVIIVCNLFIPYWFYLWSLSYINMQIHSKI